MRNRYWCEAEDREVTYGEIGRGYQLPDGRGIPVTEEELRSLPLTTARAIDLVAFIPAAAVDPLRIGAGYYLQPQGAVAVKPYVLLLRALQRASKVAVAKFAWHGRERTGLLSTGAEHLFCGCRIPSACIAAGLKAAVLSGGDTKFGRWTAATSPAPSSPTTTPTPCAQ
ncbi:Ku protein [Streptomyces sp. NPDC004629]|uniref:Ku protein n=1 Tax=Streptomyces sp. NPDC004629 TaxID=3364705 RepID=UPI00368C46D4